MIDPALLRLLRALLLAAEYTLTPEAVHELLTEAALEEEWPKAVTLVELRAAFAALKAEYDGQNGIELSDAAEGFRLRTAPDLAPLVRRLWPDRVARLSKPALESLAIIAYRQPCSRTEVEEIRGVDCGGILRTLLERRLIRVLGRKEEPGRPLIYGTTGDFLETFSLPTLRALPTLRDLESLRQEEASRSRGARSVDLLAKLAEEAMREVEGQPANDEADS